MVVLILPTVENQVKTKHVESILVPRLDESSNLSISTQSLMKDNEKSCNSLNCRIFLCVIG